MDKVLLIIEDDPGLQSQLKWCFEGFDVILAEDEASAIKAIEAHHPQVMTLDLGLPPDPGGVSVGFGLLDHVVSDYSDIKVIVITGQEDRENALKNVGKTRAKALRRNKRKIELVFMAVCHFEAKMTIHRKRLKKCIEKSKNGQ